MPEEQSAGPDLGRVLEHIDDFALNAQNYQTIQDALEKYQGNMEVPVVEKLLSICVRDLKEDMKNTVNALNVIVAVLKKNKAGELPGLPDLVPSAVAVLHIIKTTALVSKVEGLKMLCFDILQSYPNDVLITLAVSHYSEIMEMLNLYCHQRIPLEMRLQPMNIFYKLLKILPPDKRTIFVRDGVGIWFSKIVPTVMSYATSVNAKNTMPIETLEMLTEELISIDYANNPNWKVVLECIYTQQKYPAIIKNLLDSGSDLWYRLWIVFIKLLKNQIIKSNTSGKVGSPINSMLPAVETAFKMNVKNRCRAFLCWNVLIDNFSTETNQVYIDKSLKLLMIPLTSNNAKVEETVIAKLNTWWHLIRQFETKIESCFETILLPFLHFCFGKPAVPEKPVFAPGLLTINTKRQVLQAFANVAGHINCDCTVNMSKLNRKILNSNNLLVDHWDNWTNSLTMTIRICVNDNSDSVMQHFKCIWKSFIANIAEVSKSTDRYNLFVELLAILEVLLQSPRCDKLADIIFNIVTYSLLDHNGKVQPLFNVENVENNPIHKIVSLILNPSLDYVFTRYDAKEIVAKMKPLTKLIAEQYLKEVTERYLKSLLVKNNSLMLWTALAEAICELECDISMEILRNMLILPLRSMSLFTSVEISSAAWILLYKYSNKKINDAAIDEEIYEIISNQTFTSTISKKFIFRATLAILDSKMGGNNGTLICNAAETLLHVVKGMEFTFVEDDITNYINITLLLIKKVDKESNEKLAKTCILIVNNILNMTSGYYKDQNEDISQISESIVLVLEQLDLLFKKDIYSNLSSIILDDLKKYIPYFKHSGVLSVLNSMLNHKTSKNETPSPKTSPGDKSLQKEKVNTPSTDDQNKFATPVVKPVAKKGKKKDSNVADTVAENGEDYLVVNSNWKFNVKKLTDNQREKLQRTREDIPALYQDLSQSQDEFKKIYRANSIDSMSSSKTTTEKEDASEVLKNIACSNVVPRIIENILTESGKKDCADVTRVENAPTVIENPTKYIENKQLDTKSPKSPRVALKDRVFRNVRNLIEKSGLQKNDQELNATASEDLLKTPPPKQMSESQLVNSAPSDIISDRPSRVKRKPKKFDELHLLSGKKRRNSANQNNSETSANVQQRLDLESQPKKSKTNVAKANVSSADNEVSKAVPSDEKILNMNTEPNTESNANLAGDVENNTTSIIIDQSVDKIHTEKVTSDEKLNTNATDTPCVPDALSITDSFNLSDDKNKATPNKPNKGETSQTQSTKKPGRRKSRIEKELAIDMVEGHPFLKMQSEKRLTRKNISAASPTSVKRKTLVEKLNKSKEEVTVPKSEKKVKNKDKSINSSDEKLNDSFDDVTSSQSQDIIESSQESSVSTISLKSNKKPKRVPIVSVEPCNDIPKALKLLKEKQDLNNSATSNESLMIQDNNDTEISRNKTVAEEKVDVDLTENMVTQPVEEESSGEVIILSGEEPPIVINSEQTNSQSSQNTENDETQSLDPALFTEERSNAPAPPVGQSTVISEEKCDDDDTPNMTTQSFDCARATENTDCSPFKDDAQRKQDFMNNTLEISPIKILSPMPEEKKSPTPETSSDFVVITLSSPVHSNGEPFDKSDSPEIFSNDKISPDKRDQSPPREEFVMTNLSPSSSLSLKKNRPQVRSGGRAAQMLGLCVPDRMQTLMNPEKPSEPEEHKRSLALNTSARRNLRILYNSTGENNEGCDESEDSDSFLKLKRSLPTADSSPVGPILKRKFEYDDASVSPASKRKRVSFHDPPVSTTICVKKYIEPSGLHSPQNSAFKRQERQLRAQGTTKTPKRLDTAFKLDTVLTKTVESFTEISHDNDIEMSSASIAEGTNETNDTDPIFPALIQCNDRIDKIVTELSSPAMKLLLIRELEGKIETIGDFAKLTAVEVNRLSIKTPKVEVAKRVLNEYSTISEEMSSDISDKRLAGLEVEINTQAVYEELPMEPDLLSVVATQTDCVSVCNNLSQTNETGACSSSDLIKSRLDSQDFVHQLCVHLDEPSKREIARDLSLKALTEELLKKVDSSKSSETLSALLEHQRSLVSPENPCSITQLSIIQSYLCDKFDSKDIIMFCSELLRKTYEKSK